MKSKKPVKIDGLSFLTKSPISSLDTIGQSIPDFDSKLLSLRFLKKIDDFIEKIGISNREFADNIGVSESYVSQLMSGSKKLNINVLNQIEQNFNVKFELILKEKNVSLALTEDQEGRFSFNSDYSVTHLNGIRFKGASEDKDQSVRANLDKRVDFI